VIKFDIIGSEYSQGMIFQAKQMFSKNIKVKLSINEEIQAFSESSYFYVNTRKSPEDNKLEYYIDLAQKCLDIIAVHGIQYQEIKIPLENYFFWTKKSDKYLVEIVHDFTMPGINIEMQGDLVIDNPLIHESYRYFRFAQLSDDLFESFRNLWLCFESYITYKFPRNEKEKELDWYTRALQEFSKTHEQDENKYDRILNSLYKFGRCSLFHSKENQDKILPNDYSSYGKIRGFNCELSEIMKSLYSEFNGIIWKSTYVNPSCFKDSLESMFQNLRLHTLRKDNERLLTKKEIKRIIKEKSYPVLHKSCIESYYVTHDFEAKIINLNESIQRFSFLQSNKEIINFALLDELCTKDIEEITLRMCMRTNYKTRHNS